jgi:type IV secretory pathway TrbL component
MLGRLVVYDYFRPAGCSDAARRRMQRSACLAAILCVSVAQETIPHAPHLQPERVPHGGALGGETHNTKDRPNVVHAAQDAAQTGQSAEQAMHKMEELGPVVLGRDGSMSLIGNWAELNQAERAAAWKGVASRNAKRKADLLAREAADQARRRRPLGRLRAFLRQLCKSVATAWKWLRGKHSQSRRLIT